MFKSVLKMLDDSYGMRSKTIIVVPAPFWIRMIWTMIKPFLHAMTVEKFKLLTKKELWQYVPRDQILPCAGGTLVPKHNKPDSNSAIPFGVLPDLLPVRDGGEDGFGTYMTCTDYLGRRYKLFSGDQ